MFWRISAFGGEDTWKTVLALLLILTLFFSAGCGQIKTHGNDVRQDRENKTGEESHMFKDHIAVGTQKPPIDNRVPEKLETATFAMG